jgi:acylglycerol lipase
MPIASRAEPRPHPVVGSQLVRRWQPEGEVRAEVVLVHGLGEHCGRYERAGSQFAEAGLGVTAADLIGFGATGGSRGFVEDWSQFLDQVGELESEARNTGRPVVLLGHSLGGLIALDYALSERAAPDLLVLSAPAIGGGAAWQKALAPIGSRLAPRLRMPTAVKGEQLSRDPAVGEDYFADPLVQTTASNRLGAEAFSAQERVKATLKDLAIPTLVIHGGADTLVPPQVSVPLGKLEKVERRLYPTLRHESFNEPEGPEVVDEVIDWIEDHLP